MRPKTLEKLKNYIGLKHFEQVTSRSINKWQLRSKDLKQGEKLRVKQIYKTRKVCERIKIKLENHIRRPASR